MVNIQNDLRVVLGKGKAIDKYLAENTSVVRPRSVLAEHLDQLARKLQAGHALDIEDLVDVLTLKDNRGESAGDPVVALGRLVGDRVSVLMPGGNNSYQSLPEGRKQVALISTWRRVYIRDE